MTYSEVQHDKKSMQVEEHLPEAGSGSVRAKLETLLAAAAKGIAANPSSTPQDVLVFVHGVLSDAAADDRAAKKRLKAAGQGVNGTIHDSGGMQPIARGVHRGVDSCLYAAFNVTAQRPWSRDI